MIAVNSLGEFVCLGETLPQFRALSYAQQSAMVDDWKKAGIISADDAMLIFGEMSQPVADQTAEFKAKLAAALKAAEARGRGVVVALPGWEKLYAEQEAQLAPRLPRRAGLPKWVIPVAGVGAVLLLSLTLLKGRRP